MCVLDLDQTALHFRQALNFIAHIAYRWVHRVTDSSKQFFVLQVALGIVFFQGWDHSFCMQTAAFDPHGGQVGILTLLCLVEQSI